MQAACSASLSPAALGSHQTMWQRKAPGALAMMKAKERTSRPTPMKDRNRTRHSHSTASVCRHAIRGHRHAAGMGTATGHRGAGPTCSWVMVRVAGATLTTMGVQCSLLLVASAASSAALMTSMPGDGQWGSGACRRGAGAPAPQQQHGV